jgi:hypothetical protein
LSSGGERLKSIVSHRISGESGGTSDGAGSTLILL